MNVQNGAIQVAARVFGTSLYQLANDHSTTECALRQRRGKKVQQRTLIDSECITASKWRNSQSLFYIKLETFATTRCRETRGNPPFGEGRVFNSYANSGKIADWKSSPLERSNVRIAMGLANGRVETTSSIGVRRVN